MPRRSSSHCGRGGLSNWTIGSVRRANALNSLSLIFLLSTFAFSVAQKFSAGTRTPGSSENTGPLILTSARPRPR